MHVGFLTIRLNLLMLYPNDLCICGTISKGEIFVFRPFGNLIMCNAKILSSIKACHNFITIAVCIILCNHVACDYQGELSVDSYYNTRA